MPLTPLDILHDDQSLVAINKPAGLASIPGRAEATCALERVAGQLGLRWTGADDPRVRVVHRLDKETSGVLLFAKTLDAQRALCEQFQNNLAQKEYLAVVVGRPPATSGTIDAALAPDERGTHRMVVRKHGRPAQTDWKLEQAFRNHSLIRCFPRTGKTHQIRVHLKFIGLPLAVDPLYNPPRHGAQPGILLSGFKRDYRPNAGQIERPLIARLTLHAQSLTVTHPNGTPLLLQAPPPKDFRALLNQLRRHG